ncbi:hypothetical protein L596_014895 [Steinernema carpocapsae]|uniref:Uncharacterized protein n=1 Tax=Steinernema carpocapsae TaxID=34508 RepID=A0A4U5NE89_STECR|nr:hypothetical protein L596_014895 [Steinernema carpocapsae]
MPLRCLQGDKSRAENPIKTSTSDRISTAALLRPERRLLRSLMHNNPRVSSTQTVVNEAHKAPEPLCASACSMSGMRECQCDTEEDNYCYLCCGNERNACKPAHEHNILRENGERWERETCSRCRMNSVELEGLPCDDRDPQRLCLQGKCSNSVCHNKPQGAFCDRKMEKVCVEDVCENPCARYSPRYR